MKLAKFLCTQCGQKPLESLNCCARLRAWLLFPFPACRASAICPFMSCLAFSLRPACAAQSAWYLAQKSSPDEKLAAGGARGNYLRYSSIDWVVWTSAKPSLDWFAECSCPWLRESDHDEARTAGKTNPAQNEQTNDKVETRPPALVPYSPASPLCYLQKRWGSCCDSPVRPLGFLLPNRAITS